MSQCLRGKRYKTIDWSVALLICLGMTVFMLNEQQRIVRKHVDSSQTVFMSGVIILCLYLAFDSFTSNWQSLLKDEYGLYWLYLMAATNLCSTLLTSVSLIQQSDFIAAFRVVFSNHSLLFDATLLSLCSATGQMFVFYTISEFGAITFTLIMTFRQPLAIILSCITFSHSISLPGLCGIVIIFTALFTKQFMGMYKSKSNSKL